MFDSSPYYADPAKEEEQTERIFSILDRREDLGNAVFYVLKGMNDNVVVYEYDEDTSSLGSSWISIDPVDSAIHIRNGNLSLRSNLNAAEDMVFGCTVNVVEGDRHLLVLNIEQLSKRVFELVLDKDGKAAVIGVVGDTLCKLHHAYAFMKHGMLPQVDRLKLYGTSVKTGKRVSEEIRG